MIQLNNTVTKQLERNLYFICSFLLLFLTILFHFYVRPAADDFYYVTFTDNGFSEFVSKMINHHQTLTGRTFVHLILCPLLTFDMIPFRIWNSIVIFALAAVVSMFSVGKKDDFIPGYICSLSLFWLIGVSVISDGVSWGAGSLNYLFPAFMIVLYARLYSENIVKNKGKWICIIGFFAAATVEMSGILAILAVIYFSVVNINDAKRRTEYVVSNFCMSALGYITLFLTSGIKTRLDANSFYSISLWERITSNVIFFSRKICDIKGLGILMLITMVICIALAYKKRRMLFCVSSACSVILLIFVMFNIIYGVIPVCITAMLLLVILAICGMEFFKLGDRIIPFFAMCIFVSLAVCAIAPVVGFRLLLPSAVFLMIICLRGGYIASEGKLLRISFFLSLAAICSLVILIVRFSVNARVIDDNILRTKEFSGECLILQNVPDETYGGATVPAASNFGNYYLQHNNLSERITIEITEDALTLKHNEKPLQSSGIIRNGQCYVPVRLADEVAKVNISWRLAYAEVDCGEKIYRFTNGTQVTDIGYTSSEKLFYPVRLINGTTYISLVDFNRLFGVKIEIKQKNIKY